MRRIFRAFMRWLNAEDDDPIDQFETAALEDPANAQIKRALDRLVSVQRIFVLLWLILTFLPVPLLFGIIGVGALAAIQTALRTRLYSHAFPSTIKTSTTLLKALVYLIWMLFAISVLLDHPDARLRLFANTPIPMPLSWDYYVLNSGFVQERLLLPFIFYMISLGFTFYLCLLYRQVAARVERTS